MSAALADPGVDDDLGQMLSFFWHPVCTVEELAAAPGSTLGVRLLGRELVVANLGGHDLGGHDLGGHDLGGDRLACLVDRCLHRSTRLSVGRVEGGVIRCAYHGWLWDGEGRCVEVPSAPQRPAPSLPCQQAFEVRSLYGLVWVRLDGRACVDPPPCPAIDDLAMRVVMGRPYTWPVSCGRRVENFVDLSHFAWVHDGSLGRRDEPAPPVPAVTRSTGALRFRYESPPLAEQDPVAMVGASDYRVVMPSTVNIAFDITGRPGARWHLWMTASPLDAVSCRTFWMVARNETDGVGDDAVMAFQERVLEEDEAVVCNQSPELPLDRGEISVKADRVSIEYRRWLGDLVEGALDGPAAVRALVE